LSGPAAVRQGASVDLLAADRRLQEAQRAGDVAALDELLHPRVVGAGPDGTVFDKHDDLGAHRSGALRITRLVEESIDVQDDGQTGLTRVVAAVDAVQDGTEVSARLLYTRLWVRHDGRWRVLAATLVPAQPSP
jgi:ketosteroid isomerase-like protein